MSAANLALCIGFALSLAVGQSLFKWATLVVRDGGLFERIVLNPALHLALGWYAATAMLWFFILTRVPLSNAYLFSIAGSALVPLAAWLIFGEATTPRFWLGYAVVLFGLYLTLPRT